VSLSQLAAQYLSYSDHYRSSTEQVDQTLQSLSEDITHQEQRKQTDEDTYATDEYGLGCTGSISLSDPGAYSVCVNQEEQAATNAEDDEAAAQAQITGDVQQAAGLDSTISENIDTLVQELAGMAWPNESIRRDVEQLSAALVSYRSDLAQQANALGAFDLQAEEEYSARATADDSNVQNASLVVNAALGLRTPNPAPSATVT